MSSRTALALILLFLTSCHSHLTAMQRLDLLVTAAAQLCPKGSLVNPTPAKQLACHRADSCLRPAAVAQHAHQDALLAMSRMEDSSGARLAAEAATAGAIASCAAVGIREGSVAGSVVVAHVGEEARMKPAVKPETTIVPVVVPVVTPTALVVPTLTSAPVAPTSVAPATPVPVSQPTPTAPTTAP
jgi:hypothetical protein